MSVLSSVLLPAQLGGTFGQSAWNSKAFGQCRRPFLHLEAAWVQAAKLLAARLQVAGCRAAGCRVAGCKGWATGCRVDLGSSRKGAETLYCCIFRFKIHRVVAGGLAWPNTARPLIRSHREGSAIKTVGRAGAGLGWSRLWTRRPSAVESKSAKSAYLLRRFLVAILAQALSVTFFTALCRSSRRVLRPWGHTTKALAALALVPRLRESDGTRTGPLGV